MTGISAGNYFLPFSDQAAAGHEQGRKFNIFNFYYLLSYVLSTL